MLGLNRYPNEGFFLLDDQGELIARVVYKGRRGEQVSIGFQAPDKVQILREELLSPEERDAYIQRLKSR